MLSTDHLSVSWRRPQVFALVQPTLKSDLAAAWWIFVLLRFVYWLESYFLLIFLLIIIYSTLLSVFLETIDNAASPEVPLIHYFLYKIAVTVRRYGGKRGQLPPALSRIDFEIRGAYSACLDLRGPLRSREKGKRKECMGRGGKREGRGSLDLWPQTASDATVQYYSAVGAAYHFVCWRTKCQL